MSDHLFSIKYGFISIDYQLEFHNRKTLGIKVFPDSSVKVLAPIGTAPDMIAKQVKKKAPWIIRQQQEFLSYQPLTPERLYVNGETHLYLGRQYKIRIEKSKINEVKLYRGRLIIHCKTTQNGKEILNRWYKERAIVHFREILDKSIPLFKKFKIDTPLLHIRQMEKRWGSCTPTGTIILNPELVKAPKGCIEYVIIHELCHLIHHNHTKAFYILQESIMPDWKIWKDRLEKSIS